MLKTKTILNLSALLLFLFGIGGAVGYTILGINQLIDPVEILIVDDMNTISPNPIAPEAKLFERWCKASRECSVSIAPSCDIALEWLMSPIGEEEDHERVWDVVLVSYYVRPPNFGKSGVDCASIIRMARPAYEPHMGVLFFYEKQGREANADFFHALPATLPFRDWQRFSIVLATGSIYSPN